MAIWNPSIRACTTVWSTLRVLDQNDRPFRKSGDVKMAELTYWNPTSSVEMRRLQANSLANQMDNFFREIRGAKYEDGVSRNEALQGILSTLMDEEKTISDLAEVADANYLFWGEESAG